MRSHIIAAELALLFWSFEAHAQSGSGERLIQSLARCREITAPDGRLTCFDKATTALEQAVRAKDVRILDRREIRETRKSLFGFALPRIGVFGDGGDRDGTTAERAEFEELNTTIAAIRVLANDRVELRLADNDAMWVTTDAMRFPPKAGAKVKITKGAIGSYFIAADGTRAVRGMRLR